MEIVHNAGLTSIALGALVVLGIVLAADALWQLFVSPLRRVPGPFWAKVSPFWLWFRDLRGTAPEEIHTLHDRFGSIVRIGPNEVSINDPEVHNSVLFCQAPKFLKVGTQRRSRPINSGRFIQDTDTQQAGYFYNSFRTGPDAIFTALRPADHSQFRRHLSRGFSRKSILEFEPQIHEITQKMAQIVKRQADVGDSVDISNLFRRVTLDFTTKFTYGGSLHALDAPEETDPLLEAFDQFATSNFLFMMCPALRVPAIAVLSLIPSKTFQAIPNMRKAVLSGMDWYDHPEKSDGDDNSFKPLLKSEMMAAEAQQHRLSKGFLLAEGVGNIFAGTDTTSTTLALTIRELCLKSDMYNRLHEQLKTIMPEPLTTPKLIDLENVSYLTAVVKEGLRFSCPVRSRLPRVCPPSGWECEGHTIPVGTIISSGPRLMNFHEKTFKNSRTFDPSRWISDDSAYLKRLEEVSAAFSKGARSCIGRNLALAEIYITLGCFVRRFKPVRVVDKELQIKETFGVVTEKPIRIVFEQVTT